MTCDPTLYLLGGAVGGFVCFMLGYVMGRRVR
jgi:hypothetical protein